MISKGLVYKVLIGVFMLGVLLPNRGLWHEAENVKLVARENRRITAFPKERLVQKAFYGNFEKWYRDRLWGRPKSIKKWRELNFAMGVILADDIFIGRDKWLFSKYKIVKTFKYKDEKLKALSSINEACEKQGVKFVFMVAPPKEAIYMDYFPDRVLAKYKSYSYWENQLTKATQANGINYFSLTKEFMAAKDKSTKGLYFTDDHHWSYEGAAIASRLLMRHLEKLDGDNWYHELPLDMEKKKVFKEYSYLNRLGFGSNPFADAPWSSRYTDEIYSVDCRTGKEEKLKRIPSNDVLWPKIVHGEAIIKNKQISNGKTLLILGDSFSAYASPYLSQHFSTVVLSHFRNCSGAKKNVDLQRLLRTYKPDYVFLEILGNAFYDSRDRERIGSIVIKDE